MKHVRLGAVLCIALVLAACAGHRAAPPDDAPPARPSSGWRQHLLPGKQATAYTPLRVDGREAVFAQSEASLSMYRRDLSVAPSDLGRLRFSWKVPMLIEEADLARRELDDAPVRIVLAFDGDRSAFSPKNAALSELSRLLTGEPLPYATLMYVWCNRREPGTVVINPRSDRIRKLVVEGGPRNLGQWLSYERDIRADFEQAFGEAPQTLIGVALMSDTDNTRSRSSAWYGDVLLLPGSPPH